MKGIKKICYNCKYFRENAGRYGLGMCISEVSRKRVKDLVVKKDKCKEWRSKYEKM